MSGREELELGLNWNDESTEKSESAGKKFRGFHLTRSKWDPYPWVGSVETGSDAEISGLKAGDCLLQIDGEDLLGLKMSDIAILIRKSNRVRIQVWRRLNNVEKRLEVDDEINNDDKERKNIGILALEGPLPEVAIKLTTAISGVVRALECPICLESARIPVSQCVHGHILCVSCRAKSTRCPVCRVSLGQGRCLLADKCHKVFVESFGIINTSGNSAESPLSKRLFGPKQASQKEKINLEKHSPPQRAKNLISRIFPSISLDEKAASTESLPATGCTGRKWLLSGAFNLNDRTKSASTGELSRENNRPVSGSLNRLNNNDETRNSNGLLSVPPTPLWGGSTESVAGPRINCPLWKKAGCSELFTAGAILEHLSGSHLGPLIHFHNGKANLPVPFPFPEGIYVLHQDGEVFFLQTENEIIWVAGSNTIDNKWNWTLNVLDNQGTGLTFRRDVISLQEPFNISSSNTAVLPKNSSFESIEILLLETQSNEGIEV